MLCLRFEATVRLSQRVYYKKGPGFWKSPFFSYNFDIGIEQDKTTERSRMCVISPESFIASPTLLLHFDCIRDNASAFHFTKEVNWVIERDAFIHGFCGYFDTYLTDTIVLSTSPLYSSTHWQQVYFPIVEMPVKKSDILYLKVTTTESSRCPTVCLEGKIERDGKIINNFCSKPFVDGTLVFG